MHIGSVLLIIWLVIGAFAAGQRGDYHGTIGSCSKASTTAVTILTGPLNYLGVNPQIHCTAPQPRQLAAAADRVGGLLKLLTSVRSRNFISINSEQLPSVS